MGETVLALWCADDADAGARLEALRVLVAARAAGRPVRLLDLRAEPGPLEAGDDAEAERLLDALLGDGVAVERPEPAALAAALAGAGALVPVLSAARPRAPEVLVVEAGWLATTPAERQGERLAAAGHVVRAGGAAGGADGASA